MYFLSQTDLARELGVTPDAIRLWRKRYPGFPEPDAWIGLDPVPEGDAGARSDPRQNPRENSRSVPGWLPGRLEEVRRWRETGMSGQGARGGLAGSKVPG
jgi:hypothetical protein